MTDTIPDSLDLELQVPPRVRPGEPVPIRLRVHNRMQRDLDLHLRGRAITFDVEIARPKGQVVWRLLEGEIIPAIVLLRTLHPDERLELQALWDQRTKENRPLEPGEYAARGLLLVEGAPLETPWTPLHIDER